MTTILSPETRLLLVWLLATLGALLLLALLGLVLWRVVDETRFLRRRRLVARYQPQVDVLVAPGSGDDAIRALCRAPARHRPLIASLILATLRLTTGELVPRLRRAADALGCLALWTRALGDRRWWARAEAARALGLVREPSSIDALLGVLDDPHPEVRAAAIDALGRMGDPRCATALLIRLRDESRYQRARIVAALCAQGASIVPLLLDHARAHPSDTAMTVDLVGTVGATSALDDLLEWSGSPDAAVRAAALRALGSIGLDDRSFYYALRGLDDPDPDVRAMGARALGRGGRRAAVPYLAEHLGDEWVVAAHCATGLRRLGRGAPPRCGNGRRPRDRRGSSPGRCSGS